jgi:hypothetical protein
MAVSLSGCMRAHFNFTVNADDTVSSEVVIAYEDSILADAAQAEGMSIRQFLAESGAEEQIKDTVTRNDEAELADYAQDGYTGWVISSVEPQSLGDVDATGSLADTGSLDLRHQGDEFVLSGAIDLTGPQFQIPPSVADDPETQAMLEDLDLKFIFHFPGPVTSTNGVASGNTVTFEPALGAVTQIEAVAEAEPGGGGGLLAGLPPWAVGAAAGTLAIVVAAVVIIAAARSRKRKSDAAPPGPAAPPGGYGPLPAAPGSAPDSTGPGGLP